MTDDDDDRGPYAHWQCYTREANNRMQLVFEDLVTGLRSGTLTRITLPTEIDQRLNLLIMDGARDTEPEWELVDALNPVLDELGYKSISRDEL